MAAKTPRPAATGQWGDEGMRLLRRKSTVVYHVPKNQAAKRRSVSLPLRMEGVFLPFPTTTQPSNPGVIWQPTPKLLDFPRSF